MILCTCGGVCYPLKESISANLADLKTRVFNNRANILHLMSAHLRAKLKRNQGTEHKASHCHPVLQQEKMHTLLYPCKAQMLHQQTFCEKKVSLKPPSRKKNRSSACQVTHGLSPHWHVSSFKSENSTDAREFNCWLAVTICWWEKIWKNR